MSRAPSAHDHPLDVLVEHLHTASDQTTQTQTWDLVITHHLDALLIEHPNAGSLTLPALVDQLDQLGDAPLSLQAPLNKPLHWHTQTAYQFLCDCAWRIVHVFEQAIPLDRRPREALRLIQEALSANTGLAEATQRAQEQARLAWFDARGGAAQLAAGAIHAVTCGELTTAPIEACRVVEAVVHARRGERDDLLQAVWWDERRWQTRRLARYLLDLPQDKVRPARPNAAAPWWRRWMS